MLAKAHRIFALDIELALIFELTNRVFFDCFELALEIIGTYRVTRITQFGNQIAQLIYHHIGGKVRGYFFNFLEIFDAIANGFENTLGCGHVGASFASAFFLEENTALFKGTLNLVALLCEHWNKFVKLREMTLQFLELNHGFGQILFNRLGLVSYVKVVNNGLIQQFKLSIELGFTLGRHELFNTIFQLALGLIKNRKDRGNRVDHLRCTGGVINL